MQECYKKERYVLFEGYRQTIVYSKENTRLLKRLQTTYRKKQLKNMGMVDQRKEDTGGV